MHPHSRLSSRFWGNINPTLRIEGFIFIGMEFENHLYLFIIFKLSILFPMRLFKCSNCGQLLYFENSCCEQCGHKLGFNAATLQLETLVDTGNGDFKISGRHNDIASYHYCMNYEYGVCNWIIPTNQETPYCKACSLNYLIPDISRIEHKERWAKIEKAKHRLIYSLLRLKLPLTNKTSDPIKGLAFDFLSDENTEEKILTGHDDGLITLNIAEADEIEREMTKKAMDEVYRTLMGHFRHEIGHYYWDILIKDSDNLEAFRNLFGNEETDYEEALKIYYQTNTTIEWNNHFISRYASSHPWEDWAETWAHYLHIIDTLETAYAFGLSVHPGIAKQNESVNSDIAFDPYDLKDFKAIIAMWLPLTFSMNSLNRSMGLPDLYPFVISSEVIRKLAFIHQVCIQAREGNGLANSPKQAFL